LLRAASPSKVCHDLKGQAQLTPPFQLLLAPMQCNAGICLLVFLPCVCTMYVTTFDSAPHHADRVARNGMQAWRSCNGETRDEMSWRVGKDGRVNARNNTCMSRVQPPTEMVQRPRGIISLSQASLSSMDNSRATTAALHCYLMTVFDARNRIHNLQPYL
jgi:hypothetical protein